MRISIPLVAYITVAYVCLMALASKDLSEFVSFQRWMILFGYLNFYLLGVLTKLESK
jgi:hypothetical protein